VTGGGVSWHAERDDFVLCAVLIKIWGGSVPAVAVEVLILATVVTQSRLPGCIVTPRHKVSEFVVTLNLAGTPIMKLALYLASIHYLCI
jgi:hypothetical protein